MAVNCTVECPNLQLTPGSWPLWLLVWLYAIVGAFLVMLLHQGRKGALFSFRNVFLLLQVLFCVFRVCIFSFSFPWTYETLLLFANAFPLYWQFVTSSLLIVFMLKCLLTMREQPQLLHHVVYPIYGVTLVAFAVIWIVIMFQTRRSEDGSAGYDHSVAFYSAILFGSLSLLTGLIGYRIHRLLMQIIVSETILDKVRGISYSVVLYTIVFTTRAIWAITYSAKVNRVQTFLNELQERSDMMAYYFSMLVFLFIFEIISLMYLLRVFWLWTPARPDALGDQADGGYINGQRRVVTERTLLLPPAA
eukprot:m.92936 g.92936  ORF g.92936 m.92936 type:complete len:305 (-) comp15348_c0_seq1:515-1429(-)